MMVVVADYQTITDRDSPASLPGQVDALLADYLAVGIDEDRATIFAHSQVEHLNQLLVPFLSLVTVAELSRNPTVKDEMASAGLSSVSALMFTYPVHQAPTHDGLTCLVVGWPRSQFEANRADYERHYMKTFELAPGFAERVSGAARETRFQGTRIWRACFRKPYGAGWALVGDAGYHKDPITALGIAAWRPPELSDGRRSSRVLAADARGRTCRHVVAIPSPDVCRGVACAGSRRCDRMLRRQHERTWRQRARVGRPAVREHVALHTER